MAHVYVHCNPFEVLDHQGYPCATFPFDPDHAGGARRWIGASVDMVATQGRTKDEAPKKAETPVRVRDSSGRTLTEDVAVATRVVFAFDLSAQPIPSPATKHYRDGVRHGSLFPADLASAKLLGVAAKDFVDPLQALGAARTAAIASWTVEHDEAPPVASWPKELQGLVPEAPLTVAEPSLKGTD
jgi:hypothetical protein